jgi:hypothetical protein
MSWSLKEKTKEEINAEVNQSRGYSGMVGGVGKYERDVCPYFVEFSSGKKVEKVDVWNLSENQIGGLIKKVATEWGKISKASSLNDMKRASIIFKCWIDKHQEASTQFTLNFCKLIDSPDLSGAQKEVMRDLVGDYCGKKISEAKAIATYITGGNPEVSRAQIMKVLQDQVKMAEQNQVREA